MENQTGVQTNDVSTLQKAQLLKTILDRPFMSSDELVIAKVFSLATRATANVAIDVSFEIGIDYVYAIDMVFRGCPKYCNLQKYYRDTEIPETTRKLFQIIAPKTNCAVYAITHAQKLLDYKLYPELQYFLQERPDLIDVRLAWGSIKTLTEIAVDNQDIKGLQILLQFKPDIYTKNGGDKTLFEKAVCSGNPMIVTLFAQAAIERWSNTFM